MGGIKYKDGYKYQLEEAYRIQIPILPVDSRSLPFIRLSKTGILTIRKGYAWDGPSGPAIDTKNFMRGSLVHDALYQFLRNGMIGPKWRDPADQLLRKMCREDGMSWVRSWWVYKSLVWFGFSASDKSSKKETLTAP
jgi:hypothetical protein